MYAILRRAARSGIFLYCRRRIHGGLRCANPPYVIPDLFTRRVAAKEPPTAQHITRRPTSSVPAASPTRPRCGAPPPRSPRSPRSPRTANRQPRPPRPPSASCPAVPASWPARAPSTSDDRDNLRHKAKGPGDFSSGPSTYEFLVRLAGIEPTTPWFVAKYSIQLSYSRVGNIIKH